MSEVPDTWPPEEDDAPVVPMFPLRGVFLLPKQIMPLHVFEPRYRQLVEDVLDGPGRLAVATVLEGEASAPDAGTGPPRVLPIAGVGEIARHERTDDGRYLIWLFGLGRFQLEEVPSERPYRRVRVRPVVETPAPEDEEAELESRVRAALAARAEELSDVPDDVPLSLLTDALMQRLQLPQAAMEPLYCEADVARRAALVLEAHDAFPPTESDAEDGDA